MGFDLAALRDAVARHGRVARIVVAEVHGSAPREVGAAMLVWAGGQSGTIGGGALEYEAAREAFARRGLTRHPLGPSLGQCCGGAVTLLTEVWDAGAVAALAGPVIARGQGAEPLAVRRLKDAARARGARIAPQLVGAWFVEHVEEASVPLWIWGAGHVGRALVSVFSPLPDFAITWIDTAPDRFPEEVPEGVRVLPAPDPARAVGLAPGEAWHLVLTYSHEIDLVLCHGLLARGFGFAGLIGSDTKWARFRSRLSALGHSDAEIARICCPIGQKSLGKHPQAIALGVATDLLARKNDRDSDQWTSHSSASGA
ncbi:molybdenum cofactor sulfurylase [Roseivivax halodurans JCM 10272]|uniref:Molybdenum cofactor sulfurylase n=1 Tax=Roseivivax halodurans JCM 10272 TaxID=1449350 RepID=X7EFY0_9RHOB|nr:xanthine dehydrogenase accessory protein XdhC [Roseivivax halodurans]ETX14832.1 molybdenum cofactor sulfurylase [Roseivivax halodurans JCM 10272]